MNFFLIVLLALMVSCATTETKNPIRVMGVAKISESNPAVAMNLAFDDAIKKLNTAKCKLFKTISVCLFIKKDTVEVVLEGDECNPPRRVDVVPKEKDSR